MKDIKVVRGAKIGSDHYLVLLKMSKKNRVESSCRKAGGCRKSEENMRIMERSVER